MTFLEWGMLSEYERKRVKWYRRPQVKTITLFTIIVLLFMAIFVFGNGKSQTSHANAKPVQQAVSSI